MAAAVAAGNTWLQHGAMICMYHTWLLRRRTQTSKIRQAHQTTLGADQPQPVKQRKAIRHWKERITRVPCWPHGSGPHRRCHLGTVLPRPLHVTHRVCLPGGSLEEKRRKSDEGVKRGRNPMQGRSRGLGPRATGPGATCVGGHARARRCWD